MKESQLEKKCCLIAKQYQWWQTKINPSSKNGIPDRLFVKNGKYVWVEFKKKNGKRSKIQMFRQTEMKKYGMEIFTIDNFLDFCNLLSIQI